MPGSEKRQRSRLKPIRFTDDELARIEDSAGRMGISFGAYVRAELLKAPIPRQSRRPHVNQQLLCQALAQLGKVGSNLNQIARHLNSGGSVVEPEVAAVLAELRTARDALMGALSRGGHDH